MAVWALWERMPFVCLFVCLIPLALLGVCCCGCHIPCVRARVGRQTNKQTNSSNGRFRFPAPEEADTHTQTDRHAHTCTHAHASKQTKINRTTTSNSLQQQSTKHIQSNNSSKPPIQSFNHSIKQKQTIKQTINESTN